MSHYDCSDCGSMMGLRYGKCHNCTPKEVLDLGAELNEKISDARIEFDEKHFEEYEFRKKSFVDEQCSNIRTKYQKAFDKHKPRS